MAESSFFPGTGFESRVSQYNVGSRIGVVVRTSVPSTGSWRGVGPSS